jgi:uncharacterized protein YdeI (YjbR/CyaY-like superfamily)
MDVDKPIEFNNRQKWRKWLEENGNTAQWVWLVHYNNHSGRMSLSLSEGVEEALCFGWIDGQMKSLDEDRYFLRYSPRKSKSVWSKINKERAERLIIQGRMTAAGLAIIEEAKKNGYWDAAYTNKTEAQIPSDLENALLKDPEAYMHFIRFANSYRNMYIAWVVGAKTDETRVKRINEVLKWSALNKKAGIE